MKNVFALPIAPERYDKRIVVFFDILGWQNRIERAGADGAEIAKLNAVVKLLSKLREPGLVAKDTSTYLTTFSDNVVFSRPYDEDQLPNLLSAVAKIEFGAALFGFFVRGAITIGNLLHNDSVVFGPALNRAHDLERHAAKFPRIILDPDITVLQTIHHPQIEQEDEYRMLNPFSLKVIEKMLAQPVPINAIKSYLTDVQWNAPLRVPSEMQGSATSMLNCILTFIQAELNQEIPDSAKLKLEWLRGKINRELGLR